VKVLNNRRKDPLLILFLILGVLSQPVLSSAVLCLSGSDHVGVEIAPDGPASFSQCQVASSASSQPKGLDVAPKGREGQCFVVPMSGHLARNHVNSFDQTSSRIRTLTQETCSSAFGSPGTRRVNAILLDLLPFETSVSSSLQNTILVI